MIMTQDIRTPDTADWRELLIWRCIYEVRAPSVDL
jgi:hypothetical protein